MCGISGFINFNGRFDKKDLKKFSLRMGKSLRRRGPDYSGFWIEKDLKLCLSHQRLSIIDLSKRSNQPMESENERFVLVYNGEVYNYKKIRNQLSKNNINFKTDSDTEVILEAFSFWGVKKSLNLLDGMFAIALWDKHSNDLYLIRDRLGIKPLYFYRDNNNFVFSSEIKAFKELPWLNFEIDYQAFSSYVRLNYVPTPKSIYKNIRKLEPGNILKINLGNKLTKEPFWDLTKVVKKNEIEKSSVSIVAELEKMLEEKVNSHMVSDVPLGVFLSGGIDSTLITLLSQKSSKKKVCSFTIGFDESGYNEAIDAKKIAEFLGTNHKEVYFSFNEFQRLIDDISFAYDEPFADSSQLPTMLLSEMTKEDVTVALSGDGGDELFGGYYRYFMAEKYKKYIFDQPLFFKSLLTRLIKKIPILIWNNIGLFIPNKYGGKQFGDKLHKLARLLKESDENKFYERIISNCDDLSELVIKDSELSNKLFDQEINKLFPDLIQRMQIIDTLTYLPDDILTKVDRASMHNSLEVRVPFLDHHIVEYAWQIPQYLKINKGEGKVILKKILEKHLPTKLFNRPKMGFGIPLGKFIENKLKDEINYFLNSSSIKEQGLFKVDSYKKIWEEHLSGKRNWQFLIWNFYIFQKWHEKWN